MTDTAYLGAARSAVPPAFLIRHHYTNTGLHDLADKIRIELAGVGQWQPLVRAIEAVVASQPGLRFVRGFPVEDRAYAANLLAAAVCVHAATEIRTRIEVAATRR